MNFWFDEFVVVRSFEISLWSEVSVLVEMWITKNWCFDRINKKNWEGKLWRKRRENERIKFERKIYLNVNCFLLSFFFHFFFNENWWKESKNFLTFFFAFRMGKKQNKNVFCFDFFRYEIFQNFFKKRRKKKRFFLVNETKISKFIAVFCWNTSGNWGNSFLFWKLKNKNEKKK